MQVNQIKKGIEIILFRAEAILMQSIFARVLGNYNIHPDELGDDVRNVWYPRNVEKTEEGHDDDLAEFIRDDFRSYRSENAAKLRDWINLLAADEEMTTLVVLDEDVDRLLTILNDHRLFRAAELGIGQDEMDKGLEEIEDQEIRGGMLEIHFLAWLMELVIRVKGSGYSED